MRISPRIYARSIPFFIIICFCSTLALGQALTSKWELGAQISQFIYQGDLAPAASGSYKTPGYGLGIYANRILNRSFSLRTSLVYGKLKGDDSKYPIPAWRQQRNLAFSSPVFEISEMLVWNPLGNNMERYSAGFSPYLFGGAGYSFLHITRDWSRFNAHAFQSSPAVLNGLAADQQHALPVSIPVIPVGAGLRYGISPSLAVTLEAAYRFTFTDYLDGFSQVANPAKNDRYYTLSAGLVYKFVSSDILRCPVIKL